MADFQKFTSSLHSIWFWLKYSIVSDHPNGSVLALNSQQLHKGVVNLHSHHYMQVNWTQRTQ